MSQKNISMEIKTDQFEILENDKVMKIDGGTESNTRDNYNIIWGGFNKIIDFFKGN